MKYIELVAVVSPVEIGRDLLINALGEVGFDTFEETPKGVKAYTLASTFDKEKLNEHVFFKNPMFAVEFAYKEIVGENWNTLWEENFKPISVSDKCFVRAPFHDSVSGFQYEIIVSPKMAFGTGHHATTFMMIDEMCNLDLQKKAVLDMGCGTGILSILASKMGASQITGIDIDPWSYKNAQENALLNEIKNIDFFEGDEKLIQGSYAVVLANINRNVLLSQMSSYIGALDVSGHILLSGFLTEDSELMCSELEKNGMKLVNTAQRSDWVLLNYKKM